MQPTVSFGVPVYNGHRHLRETLDSLLAQTYSDFELIISDNASTDATPDICQEYASRDSRIQYHRQTENVGAPENWNFVARKARGRRQATVVDQTSSRSVYRFSKKIRASS
jgi:glycosyltransferase involved in cell wall biosynthesis